MGFGIEGNCNIFQTHECLLSCCVQFEIVLTGEITEVYLNSCMSMGSVETPPRSGSICTSFVSTVSTVVVVGACKQEVL